MDNIRKGTWLISAHKHFVGVRQDAPELEPFEATEVAGKAGALLARLVADKSEVIPGAKVKVLARQSSVKPTEIRTCLGYLRQQGKLDFKQADGC